MRQTMRRAGAYDKGMRDKHAPGRHPSVYRMMFAAK
jgi:hypothetical protein